MFGIFVHFAMSSAVDSGGARAPPEFGGSEKGQSLISAYRSLAITAKTSGIEKLPTALPVTILMFQTLLYGPEEMCPLQFLKKL